VTSNLQLNFLSCVCCRKGSVIAVVDLAWPKGTVDPKEPLLSAIMKGHFAGHSVKTQFVSPTPRERKHY
jgi:hypothetical protein